MSLPTPYYEDEHSTIYCADCRDVLPHLPKVDLVLTDPPYGIAYKSGQKSSVLARSIHGDEDTKLRDYVCSLGFPSMVFGTWKKQPPEGTRETLVWDKGAALGMGDLSLPWKRTWEEIYILGDGWHGKRGEAVLRFSPVQSMAKNGRVHPHQKPTKLIKHLFGYHGGEITVDPFMGSGTTLVAAKQLGRKAIGIELEEKYCAIAVDRLRQGVLGL
jgi:DNA modification methylase